MNLDFQPTVGLADSPASPAQLEPLPLAFKVVVGIALPLLIAGVVALVRYLVRS